MNEPKVGIYMPAYNHERYVAEAVDSVLNQTYPNWELFIVNDGSTDRTGEILRRYGDKRIHYYEFEVNTKYVGAANYLQNILKNRDVQYIADIASDDVWRRDKLEKQIRVLTEHKEYKACFTWDRVLFEEDGGTAYRGNEAYSHKNNRSRFDWIRYFFKYGNCLNACSVMIDKELFYQLDRMNENFIQLGDFRLWFKLALTAPFYLIEEELTVYRRHGSNLSEPSLEVYIRDRNETYHILTEIMDAMEPDVFWRAFYTELPYVKTECREELKAAEFVLLKNMGQPVFDHAAIELYYRNCADERFVEILKDKYFYESRDFIELTGNGGMAYLINQLYGKEVLASGIKKDLSPACILLDTIDRGLLRETSLHDISYNVLYDLYQKACSYEGGEKQYEKIKQAIAQIRKNINKKLSHKSILLISHGNDLPAFEHLIEKTCENYAEKYIAVIPTKKECFSDREVNGFRLPNGLKLINLYDEREHCLRFPKEAGIEPDAICCVNCLDSRFECAEMLLGCSLDIHFICILNSESYQIVLQENGYVLGLMDEVITD